MYKKPSEGYSLPIQREIEARLQETIHKKKPSCFQKITINSRRLLRKINMYTK